jgi:hypothetical protein
MEVSGQLHAVAVLTREKNSLYPLNRTVDGPQAWSGGLRKKQSLTATGNSTTIPRCPTLTARSPLTVWIERRNSGKWMTKIVNKCLLQCNAVQCGSPILAFAEEHYSRGETLFREILQELN